MVHSLYNNRPQLRFLILGALACGIAFLQRPVTLLLPMAFALWYCLRLVLGKREMPFPRHIKIGLCSFVVFVLVFAAVASPYIMHNFSASRRPLPDLPSKLGVIFLQAYRENPEARSINSDLSHYPQMRRVYNDATLKIDYFTRSDLRDFLRKGIHELDILAHVFKTSRMCPIALLFLMFLSYFFVDTKGRALLELLSIFLLGNIVLVPFYQHVEPRYFIFLIPFVAIYSAAMFGWFDAQIINIRLKIAFRAFVTASVVVMIALPNIRSHSFQDEAIMGNSPYRLSYYSARPAVMLPLASADTIQEICKRYKVRYVVAAANETQQFADRTTAAKIGSLHIIDAAPKD